MSGPKIDQAELDRQRRAAIERERQERLRKIRTATEQLSMRIDSAKGSMTYIDRHLCSLMSAADGIDEMAFTLEQLKEIKKAYKLKLSDVLKISVPSEADEIVAVAHSVGSRVKEIMAHFEKDVEPLQARLEDFLKQKGVRNAMEDISHRFFGKAEAAHAFEDLDFSAMAETVSEVENIEEVTRADVESVFSEIEGLVNSGTIQGAERKGLLAIANNIYSAACSGVSSSLKAAIAEYKAARSAIRANIAAFEDTYQLYYAEYVVYVDLLNARRTTPLVIVPKERHRFESIEQLQNETEQIRRLSSRTAERNYIRRQIDEVMKQFGYNVSEEIVLNENQSGNHYVCASETGHSAIHVYVSDKKQIMMEIVSMEAGRNLEERAVTGFAVGAAELTEEEKEYLLVEQGKFCSLHPRIVREIRKRGVILNEKVRKAPGLRYCKKIINFSSGDSIIADDLDLINVQAKERRFIRGSREKLLEMK